MVKQFRARELIFCTLNIKTYAARLYTSTLCALQVEKDESKWSWPTSLLGKEPWPLTLLGRDVNEGRRQGTIIIIQWKEIGNEPMIEKAIAPSQADKIR